MLRFGLCVLVAAAWAAVGLASASAQFGTTSGSSPAYADCADLTLQAAERTSQGGWSYRFAGVCRMLVDRYRDGERQGTDEIGRAFAEVRASWDAGDNEARELIDIDGATVAASARCATDPFQTNGTCVIQSMAPEGEWGGLIGGRYYANNRLAAAGRTNAAEAGRLADQTASAPPPPPPPPPAAPPPTVTTSPPNAGGSTIGGVVAPLNSAAVETVTIEGEAVVASAVVSAGAPGPSAQDMSVFGRGWSRNAQLFWPARATGEYLLVPLTVPADGVWEATAYFTGASDFGQMSVAINSGPPGNAGGWAPALVSIDGYRPGVVQPRAYALGAAQSVDRVVTVSIAIAGRAAAASGHYVGLDRVVLTRR